jgi:hypothetical protein
MAGSGVGVNLNLDSHNFTIESFGTLVPEKSMIKQAPVSLTCGKQPSA